MSGLHPAFDVFHVEQSLRSQAPEIVFAMPRMVRRIIRAQHDLPVGLARLPHRDIAIIGTQQLAALADDVLVFPANLPKTVLLIARPDAERFENAEFQTLLREYWRLAFHALLDFSARRLLDDPVEGAAAREQMAAWIGTTTAAEAKTVLVQEGLLRPGADERETLAEFVAVFLELRCFAPGTVWAWFPSINDPEDSPISSAVSVCSSARCRRRTIRRRCHKSRRGSGRHPSAGPSGFGRGRQRCGNGPIVRRSGATWCGRRSTNGGPHRFGRMALGRRPDDSTARSTPSPGGSAGRSTSTRQPSPRPRS